MKPLSSGGDFLSFNQKSTIEAFLRIFQTFKKPKQISIKLIVSCLKALNNDALNTDEKMLNTLSDSIDKILKKLIKNLQTIDKFKKFKPKYLIASMKIMRKYEKILFSGLSDYRDHFFHQFWVFLIGVILIELNYEDVLHGLCHEIYDNEDIKTRSKIIKLRPSVDALWAFTALFHDQTYLLEKITAINENIYNQLMPYKDDDDDFNIVNKVNLLSIILCSEKGEQYFNEIIENLSKGQESRNNLRRLFKKQLDKKESSHSHAMLSALFMMHKLRDYVIDHKDKSLIAPFIHNIVTAIAMHHLKTEDLRHLVEKGRIENHFLHYLLRLCDYVQEWNRTDRKDKTKYEIGLRSIELKDNNLHIYIDWRKDFKKNLAAEYHVKTNGYFKYKDILKSKIVLTILHGKKVYPYEFPL